MVGSVVYYVSCPIAGAGGAVGSGGDHVVASNCGGAQVRWIVGFSFCLVGCISVSSESVGGGTVARVAGACIG